jgi:hypothetical protein
MGQCLSIPGNRRIKMYLVRSALADMQGNPLGGNAEKPARRKRDSEWEQLVVTMQPVPCDRWAFRRLRSGEQPILAWDHG